MSSPALHPGGPCGRSTTMTTGRGGGHAYLSYRLGGGDELAVVVVDEGLLLGVEGPGLGHDAGVDAQQVLEAGAGGQVGDVGGGIEVGGVEVAGRHLGVGHVDAAGRRAQPVVLAEGGAVGAARRARRRRRGRGRAGGRSVGAGRGEPGPDEVERRRARRRRRRVARRGDGRHGPLRTCSGGRGPGRRMGAGACKGRTRRGGKDGWGAGWLGRWRLRRPRPAWVVLRDGYVI